MIKYVRYVIRELGRSDPITRELRRNLAILAVVLIVGTVLVLGKYDVIPVKDTENDITGFVVDVVEERCIPVPAEECTGVNQVCVARLSSLTNAHLGSSSGSGYPFCVCCAGEGLTNVCEGNYGVFARISSETNAHGALGDAGYYMDNVSLCLGAESGTVTCHGEQGGCTTGSCVLKLHQPVNAHGEACTEDHYDYYACCDIAGGALEGSHYKRCGDRVETAEDGVYMDFNVCDPVVDLADRADCERETDCVHNGECYRGDAMQRDSFDVSHIAEGDELCKDGVWCPSRFEWDTRADNGNGACDMMFEGIPCGDVCPYEVHTSEWLQTDACKNPQPCMAYFQVGDEEYMFRSRWITGGP